MGRYFDDQGSRPHHQDSRQQGGSYGQKRSWNDSNSSNGNSSWKSSPQTNVRGRYSESGSGIALGLDPKNLAPIAKNFYKEDAAVSAMTSAQVEEFRSKNEMSIYGREVPRPITTFEQTGFPEAVVKKMLDDKYTLPTPIQAQGWPMALSGRNMVGIAQTGSGKTLSYILPGLIHISHQVASAPAYRKASPKALILAPTRELAIQIHEVARKYGNALRIKSVCVFGGAPRKPQLMSLQAGCDLLIATPGRLNDFVHDGTLTLDQISYLVLDEADRMLDMGFEPQLREFLPMIRSDRQVLMWSATWPKAVQKLSNDLLGGDFIQVQIGATELTANKKIKQDIRVLASNDMKEDNLAELLQSIWDALPGDEATKQMVRTIVFCNTKRNCDRLVHTMQQSGWPAAAMHGDLQQSEREGVLRDFRSGRRPIFVCTDVAARGLDVKDVRVVVNYDFPNHFEDYIHRIGRTARGADTEGHAYSFFVASDDKGSARELVKLLNDAEQPVPQELDALVPRRQEGRGGFSRFNRGRGFASRGGGRGGYGGQQRSYHQRY